MRNNIKFNTEFLRKNKKYRVFVVFATIVLTCLLIVAIFYTQTAKKDLEIKNKLKQLSSNDKDATCENVIKELGKTSVEDVKDYKNKIILLDKQILCFAGYSEFDKAISSAEKLKKIYSQNNDTRNEDNTAAWIAQLQKSKEESKKK